jgi:hypothetical protein
VAVAVLTVFGEHHGVSLLLLVQEPEAVLQAAHRIIVADVDILELRRCDLDGTVILLEELREAHRLVRVLLAQADEGFRDAALAEQLVEGALQVDVLTLRKLPRGHQHLVGLERRAVSHEPLEDVAFRALGAFDRRRAAGKQRCAALHAVAADQPGVAGNDVLDVLRRLVTELTTSLGDEKIGHASAPARIAPSSAIGRFPGRCSHLAVTRPAPLRQPFLLQ